MEEIKYTNSRPCPHCGRPLNSSAMPDGYKKAIANHDNVIEMTICIYCNSVLFVHGKNLILIPEENIKELSRHIQNAINNAKKAANDFKSKKF